MDEYKPRGLFISQNNKGQYIYSDPFIKGGYIISKSHYQQYRTYALRYVIGIVVVILLTSFIDIIPSLIVGMLTIMVGEILFRIKFLKKACIYDKEFYKDYKSSFLNKANNPNSKIKQIIRSVLLIAFGILLILNAYQQKYIGIILIICWIIGILCIILAIFLLILLIIGKEKKNG